MRNQSSYEIWKLVNQRIFIEERGFCHPLQIICDIDKTYLETKFESLAMLAKIAIESSEDKVTVQGADVVLSWLRWGCADDLKGFSVDQVIPLHFVSSSPPQLRRTLEEKLMFDGLMWSSDTFKDQAYNIMKGKFKLLKHQIPYKVAAILNLIGKMRDQTRIILIGDNAESDPLIYQAISLLLSDKISQDDFVKALELKGVQAEQTRDILRQIPDLPKGIRTNIFIRRLEKYSYDPSPIGGESAIYYFDHYLELAIQLLNLKLMDPRDPFRLMQLLHNNSGFSLRAIMTGLDAAKRIYPHMESIYDQVSVVLKERNVDVNKDQWTREVLEKRWREFLQRSQQDLEAQIPMSEFSLLKVMFGERAVASQSSKKTNPYLHALTGWLNRNEP